MKIFKKHIDTTGDTMYNIDSEGEDGGLNNVKMGKTTPKDTVAIQGYAV